MPAENQQPNPEPAQNPTENQNSEVSSVPVSPQEAIPDAPIPTPDSAPAEMPPVAPEAPLSPESAVPVTNDIPANEPLGPAPVAEILNEPNNPNITIEKNGNDVTITEVMNPTAQIAGNEPLNTMEAEKIKQRKENLEKANETRQNKKREKIDAILDLFAKQTNLTNDEVEKLLHVSDATATRYLETLEKEGKIKQVGKTGKYTHYEKM